MSAATLESTSGPRLPASSRGTSRLEEIAALVAALSFGPYENPLGLPKVILGDQVVLATAIDVLSSPSSAAPGMVTHVSSNAIHVATSSTDVALRTLLTIDGRPLSLLDVVARAGLQVGSRLEMLDRHDAERLTTVNEALAKHERFWVQQLSSLSPIDLPYANRSTALAGPKPYAERSMPLPAELTASGEGRANAHDAADLLVAAFAIYLARLGGTENFDLGFSANRAPHGLDGLDGLFAAQVPLHVQLRRTSTIDECVQAVVDQLAQVRAHKTYARDVLARFPQLSSVDTHEGGVAFPVVVEQAERPCDAALPRGCELAMIISRDGTACRWVYDFQVYSEDAIARMQEQFTVVLRRALTDGGQSLGELSLLSDAERHRVLTEWNNSQLTYSTDACIHHLIEAQVERTPDAVAVIFCGRQLTYRELDRRANRVARYLQNLGVGPETLVGICMERSIELLVGLLGIHKAGGAYVPLDPTYPHERLDFMVEDSKLSVLLTQSASSSDFPSTAPGSCAWTTSGRPSTGSRRRSGDCQRCARNNLAYVIYTSGSTGKPEGRHGRATATSSTSSPAWTSVSRTTARRLAGGDQPVVRHLGAGAVLDACARLQGRPLRRPRQGQPARTARSTTAGKPIDFSLFYFASDEGESVADKYRLLLEGAQFADRQRLRGRLDAGAALPRVRRAVSRTRRWPAPRRAPSPSGSSIRAGSVVLPLHTRSASPRSGRSSTTSRTAGWGSRSRPAGSRTTSSSQPENFADRKNAMLREHRDGPAALARRDGRASRARLGDDVEVRTLPRPVQPELPVWVTAAGNPETFRPGRRRSAQSAHAPARPERRGAGREARDLPHRPGETQRPRRRRARDADAPHVRRRRRRGRPRDRPRADEGVPAQLGRPDQRRPPGRSRRSRSMAPTTGQTPGESSTRPRLTSRGDGRAARPRVRALLQDQRAVRHARDVPGDGRQAAGDRRRRDRLPDRLRGRLRHGAAPAPRRTRTRLQELAGACAGARSDDSRFPALIARHEVTHLQCTPSMASMLLMDERESRRALARVDDHDGRRRGVPVALGADARASSSRGEVINMYGPTETTIWSSTCTASNGATPRSRSAGRSRTRELYILDHAPPAGAGRARRRAVHRRRRRRARLPGIGPSSRPSASSPTRSAIRDGPPLPHRRPGPLSRRRQRRVPRPDRPSGQDPRLPHRAGRDRVAAPTTTPAVKAGRGHRARGRARRPAPGRVRCAAW